MTSVIGIMNLAANGMHGIKLRWQWQYACAITAGLLRLKNDLKEFH